MKKKLASFVEAATRYDLTFEALSLPKLACNTGLSTHMFNVTYIFKCKGGVGTS